MEEEEPYLFITGDPMLIVSYKISLKGLIYYFYHLTTLKHLEDLNMMFLDYLILLLYIGYKILHMEHNSKKYYFILIRMSQMLQF